MAATQRVYTRPMEGHSKTARVHLRIAPEDKALFERAGTLHEETLTEFLVESGRERAERLLADRSRFVLDDDQWEDFVATLDRPARARPEVTALFARPRPE